MKETTIPVPEIIAFSYTAESPIGHGFIITEYVEGTTLNALGFRIGRKWQNQNRRDPSSALASIYGQLADVYTQLRGLEFSKIGALGMPMAADQDITVRHRPLPIEALLQHVEGLDPTCFFPENKTFSTSCEYVAASVKLAMNLLRKTRNPDIGPGEEDAQNDLFAYYTFCRYVSDSWTRKSGNSGPFVLMHGDMSLHGDNLIWDKDLNLRAVIDWEWSYTVPIQCFIPPAWLNGFYPEPIRHLSGNGMAAYQIELISFCNYMAERRPGSPLVREWRSIFKNSRHLIVLALLYPDTIIDVYWSFLNFRLYPLQYGSLDHIIRYREESQQRLHQFFEAEAPGRLLQTKLSEQKDFDDEYETYLEKNGGKTRLCQCEGCRDEQENFEISQELPFLSQELEDEANATSTSLRSKILDSSLDT
ncbi:hypothetical protein F5X99DRAFT_146324 [Biscogniauxia marginata]|nr:hypothetical protein F5X99DRAFT_146324 [Biscogniauxia marginata]